MNAMSYATEALDVFRNNLKFVAMLPRVTRVRRRGFRSDVRRGDHVRHGGKVWMVARRSNWSLWLYEDVPMKKNATIKVTLPHRYSTLLDN